MNINQTEKTSLVELLMGHHTAFCLEEGERGETDLIQATINTGEALPKKLPMRRMPFTVRQEVAKQLKKMQEQGVIQPSSSPWASPVVLVRKKDGTHRFCVDYRELNSVTKPDTFPLPCIDDLLDQLGESKYFSTLDLASGYWQIRVDRESQEKTAFVTPQGLFEFRVMPFGLTNAPAVFQRLMQRVLVGLNPEGEANNFVSVYIDDILVFSRTLEDHMEHLRLVIERLCEAGLKLKPSKCSFFRQEVEYLGHLITPSGLKTNPRLVAAVKDFPTPQNLSEVRRFLGMSSYYRRFIEHFSRITQPLHALTRKGVEFSWNEECEQAFRRLKEHLTRDPLLAYPAFNEPFVLETDASIQGLGAVLSQKRPDDRLHPVAYASRSLSAPEKNYSISELETLAVVWVVTHYRHYLYGNEVLILTDHSAVRAILETANPSGKHARWWTKVYGSGIKNITVRYRPGKENHAADALSRSPLQRSEVDDKDSSDGEVQVAIVTTNAQSDTVKSLLQHLPCAVSTNAQETFASEQRQDSTLSEMLRFLEGVLPTNSTKAQKIAAQAPLFNVIDHILYYLDPKHNDRKRVVLPAQWREYVMQENHRGRMGGHFAGKKLYNTLARHWWWENMYSDVIKYCRNCPECAIVSGGGQVRRPPLHPIPVQRPFQIVGVDLMELPLTKNGNRYVIVFQDFFTKWPLVFPLLDQKSSHIAKLLVEEIIPFCGVPEALLSDRGANLLSSLVLDTCDLLGIKKLNTTSYHPQCDGMVERFNRTLKSMLRKHAASFGDQWDRYLSGVLWAYRNTPHDTTGEKPSFLLFGLDCQSPTQASLLPTTPLQVTNICDYREELMLSLSSARGLAERCIQQAQRKYKKYYDKKATQTSYQAGDWVLVRFPHEETGRLRKLSRPWHGPYRVLEVNEPDATVSKVYFPEDGQIQVHLLRITPCPPHFPAGYYWYGRRKCSPGRVASWVQELLAAPLPSLDGLVGCNNDNQLGNNQTQSKLDGSDDSSESEEHESRPSQARSNTRYSLRDHV